MAGMHNIVLIVPIALPLLGAGTLLFLGEGTRHRSRDPLPALIAGTVFAAAVLLAEHIPTQTEPLPWPSIRAFGSPPAILVDQFALVFVFALALLAIAATITGDTLGGQKWAMSILLWGGCLGIVISANPLMLLLSWIVCEFALIGASLITRESRLLMYRLAAGGAGVAVLVLLAIRAEGHPPANLQTVLAGLSPRWIAAFFAVGAIRMGLYPLHLASFGETDAPLAPLVLGRLAGALAGLYLWFRAFTAVRGLPPQIEYLAVVGGVAALISAMTAWGARGKRSLFSWLVGFELGVIVVAQGLAVPERSILAALEMLNLLLAGSVFGLSLHAIDGIEGCWTRGWVRGLGFLAMASLLGLPPTPGFVARWGLYRQAIETGHLAPILPVVVAGGLLVPALLSANRVRRGRPVRRLSGRAVAGLTILGLPLVLASAQPLLLTPILDIMTNVKSYAIMAPLIRAASTRLSAQVIALIVVPALVGYSLDRVYDRWRARGRLDPLRRFLSLEWLYDVLASTGLRAAIAVSILLTFLELGSTVGLVAVAGLLVVLMMLRR
jgi:formate hydrogenlyase subunit 3/multisubunit Na+/H+ antiporter MnhD subunit